MNFKQVLLGSVVSIFSVTATAQQHDDQDDDDDGANFMIGALYGTDQSIYVGGDDQNQLFPFISFEYGRYFLEGPSLGAYLYQDQNWSVAASIDLDGIGDDNRDDSKELADMGDFDTVIMASLSLGYEADWGEMEFSLGTDVSSSHEGHKAELSYSYPFMLGGWRIQPEVAVEWSSEEINQYYYGVSEEFVTDTRPLYTPSAGVNYEVGVSAMYPFMQRHAIMLRAGYTAYSSEITDSPIVDRDNSTEFGIGYIYSF